MLYKVVPAFESVDEILKCAHSNDSHWAVLSHGAVYYGVQGGSNFWVCGWNPSVTIQMRATEQYFPVVLFILPFKVALTFESVEEILKCDHWNKKIPKARNLLS